MCLWVACVSCGVRGARIKPACLPGSVEKAAMQAHALPWYPASFQARFSRTQDTIVINTLHSGPSNCQTAHVKQLANHSANSCLMQANENEVYPLAGFWLDEVVEGGDNGVR